MQLRQYQIAPVEKGVKYFNTPAVKPSIIVAPTAAGKSIIIAEIVDRIKSKVIVLQPSKELLKQNYEKFINLGGKADIFSASMNTKELGSITYATIGSIIKASDRVKRMGINKIIIDECDRFPRENSGMLRKFLESINAKHVLGLTATPLKLQTNLGLDNVSYSKLVMLTNKSKKGNYFKDIIHVIQVQEMLSLGYWSEIKYDSVKFDSSDLVLNSSGADFTDASIEKSFTNQSMDETILAKIKQYSDRKSILVAVPTIENAVNLSKKVPNSAALHSNLKSDERDNIIDGFKTGTIKVIFQVNILTVGFDYPELDCLICARPTASLSWWYQFVGRGTRIHPNKKDVLVVDLVDSLSRFGRVEDLVYKKDDKDRWELFGQDNRLLTSVAISNLLQRESSSFVMPFGKYKGQTLDFLPQHYRSWLLENITWNDQNRQLKEELNRLSYGGN
jgi:DNA repair protein RadD